MESSLAREGIEHEVFSGSEANRRYPDQLTLPRDYKCVFEKDGGILLASKAVGAMQVCGMHVRISETLILFRIHTCRDDPYTYTVYSGTPCKRHP